MSSALLSLCLAASFAAEHQVIALPGKDYLVFQLTNVAAQDAAGRIAELHATFGPVKPDDARMPAFGPLPPLLMKDSVETLREKVEGAFDLAEELDFPVYFQLDDVNFVSEELAEDPAMVEWLGFPAEGEEHGPIARYWFNWGAWAVLPAYPALGSPAFQDYIVEKLRAGVLEPMARRVRDLEAGGKGYLFAGVAVGWETQIPNYAPGEPIFHIDPDGPPVAEQGMPGCVMRREQMRQLGWASLHWRGYDMERLEREAEEEGVAPEERMRRICYDVIRDYSALLARTVAEAGLPQSHIFTHMVPLDSLEPPVTSTMSPPIEAAVNPYSTPGWTLSRTTAPFDLANIKRRVAEVRGIEPGAVSFICAESYFLGQNTRAGFARFLEEMFGNGATRAVIWGITDPPATPYAGYPRHGAIRAALEWLGRCD